MEQEALVGKGHNGPPVNIKDNLLGTAQVIAHTAPQSPYEGERAVMTSELGHLIQRRSGRLTVTGYRVDRLDGQRKFLSPSRARRVGGSTLGNGHSPGCPAGRMCACSLMSLPGASPDPCRVDRESSSSFSPSRCTWGGDRRTVHLRAARDRVLLQAQ